MGNIEGFECKLGKVESLEDWFSKEHSEDGSCRPCRLQPLASLYLSVLNDAGKRDEADSLSQAWIGENVLTITRTMDKIRLGAEGNLRKDLEDLDCLAQTPDEKG